MAELTTLSLGAGVQTSTVLMLSEAGILPRLDAAIFADTGWEPAAVYQHLETLKGMTSIPIYTVTAGNLREATMAGYNWSNNPFFDIPAFTRERGMTSRQCTTNYKVKPIKRQIRQLLGDRRLTAGLVEQWLGISTDEAMRMKPSRDKYIVNRWPLIDLGMSRADCLRWWTANYPAITPPKSACLGCPFHSKRVWIALYRRGGPEWDDTVAVDERLREPGYPGTSHLDGPAYLAQSCRPLKEQVADWAAQEDANPHLPGLEVDGYGNECEGHCGV